MSKLVDAFVTKFYAHQSHIVDNNFSGAVTVVQGCAFCEHPELLDMLLGSVEES